MLTKELVKAIKSAKKAAEFSAKLNSLYPNSQGYYLPSQFKDAVTDAIIHVCPQLSDELKNNPITNDTANAIASKLE